LALAHGRRAFHWTRCAIWIGEGSCAGSVADAPVMDADVVSLN